MAAELPPRLQKDDVVRIVGVFSTGDVVGVVQDEYQSVVKIEGDDPPPAKRRVYIDGEDAFPLLAVGDRVELSVGGLDVYVNESDLFVVGGGA